MFEVLKMFIIYDNKNCGYVQGMNFIAGALTYHASPELSFCMFAKLMQNYQILDNYEEGLKGLKQRQYKIEFLMRRKLPNLQKFFDEHGVSTEMYTMEIIMGLFGTVIPFDHLTAFYDCFIRKSWDFFDHLLLVVL